MKERTKVFAHKCVKLALSLPKDPVSSHISRQLIRCGTSVAANYRASLLAQTKAAFISKISIVIEEADESEFWLEFLMDENFMARGTVQSLLNEAHELSSIFVVTGKTAQGRRRNQSEQGNKSTIKGNARND